MYDCVLQMCFKLEMWNLTEEKSVERSIFIFLKLFKYHIYVEHVHLHKLSALGLTISYDLWSACTPKMQLKHGSQAVDTNRFQQNAHRTSLSLLWAEWWLSAKGEGQEDGVGRARVTLRWSWLHLSFLHSSSFSVGQTSPHCGLSIIAALFTLEAISVHSIESYK